MAGEISYVRLRYSEYTKLECQQWWRAVQALWP